MTDPRSILEREMNRVEPLPFTLDGFMRRRDRKRRNQRILAGVVGIALFVVPVALIAVLSTRDRASTPAGRSVSGVPKVDYVIDLNTGEMTPLPRSIIGTRAENWAAREYAVSPDGSKLAYSGRVGPGLGQIFIASLDGTGVRRQVTDDPEGASSPAWSPDGTKIAYEGIGNRRVRPPVALFVLDIATGESTQIVESTRIVSFEGPGPPFPLSPQFTPDGSSLIYTDGTDRHPEVRTVPVAGGKSELLIGAGGGSTGAWNGTLSPDGTLLTFLDGQPYSGLGPRRWVASADGTERRLLPDVYGIPCVSNPAGTWSPDGSRIVCSEASRIVVIDIATGDASSAAVGREAIWLDDQTLLVSL
jgi:Tol biopolymer transport system component